jgi:hypothetical protein
MAQAVNWQTVEALKGQGMMFAAGALAKQLGHGDSYGCHFGMRSTVERDRAEFHRGYASAPRVGG